MPTWCRSPACEPDQQPFILTQVFERASTCENPTTRLGDFYVSQRRVVEQPAAYWGKRQYAVAEVGLLEAVRAMWSQELEGEPNIQE